MAGRRVAVVTGANKGIGFEIVKGLCKSDDFDGDVYLTARDEGRGNAAVKMLQKEGLKPKFFLLDVTDPATIEALRNHLQATYGGLDLLVNNAGIAYKVASNAPFVEQADVTAATNFYGTLNVCKALFPILRSHARVVTVSSRLSVIGLKDKCSPELRERWLNVNTMEGVIDLVKEFIQDAKEGKHKERGWPDNAYTITKIGLTVMTPIQQRRLDDDKTRTDIIINACCPGYSDTDLTSHKGSQTPAEGAHTPLYLALLDSEEDDDIPRGKFLADSKVEDWRRPSSN